jgi:Fe-S oxidoreductase
MAGYDKLLPTFTDAVTQLRLLARSATAQSITSYSTFITGPATPEKEMHIVLLDNGRSEMRADPRFKDALRCIRCAACANVCPPYQQVGGHAFGHIYTGAIGLVVTPFHHGLEADAGPQSLCVSCNACETICPVEIPLPSLILDVRSRVVEKKGLHWLKRVIFGTMAHPRLFGLLTRLGSIAQWPITRGSQYIRERNLRLFKWLPLVGGMKKLAKWRSLPAFAVRPLRDRVRTLSTPQSAQKFLKKSPATLLPGSASRQRVERKRLDITVCYFAGCMTDRLYPEMGEAVIKVLQTLGVKVVFPQQQNCCGLPALNSGDRQHGLAMAKQTVVTLENALRRDNADYILSASTSCVVTIVQDYIKLFEDLKLEGWLRRAQALADKIIDFTSFMDRVVKPAGIDLPIKELEGDVSVTYHDSCQSCNCLGLRSQGRQVIQNVLGLDLREMPQSDVCCGFGGSTSIEQPEIAERLLNNKLNNAQSTGAAILVADNPGCLMHLRGGVDASGRPLRVLHIAQLVAEQLEERG